MKRDEKREREEHRERSFFPRRAANVGITNRRPATRQRPAVLKQTASTSTPFPLLSLSPFTPPSLPAPLPPPSPRRVYARAMANRDWRAAVNAPFVPN